MREFHRGLPHQRAQAADPPRPLEHAAVPGGLDHDAAQRVGFDWTGAFEMREFQDHLQKNLLRIIVRIVIGITLEINDSKDINRNSYILR